MGCDIHPHVEHKDQGSGLWYRVGSFAVGRNSELFGVMAGVRGGSPIIQPRGLPRDADTLVHDRYEAWDADAHSSSWLTTSEFENVLGHYRSRTNSDMPREYGAILAFMKALDKNGESRLVFWFDN